MVRGDKGRYKTTGLQGLLYMVRVNYKSRNMSLPFVHRWAAGIPGGDGDQGRAWPDSAGSQREQFQ